MDIEGFTKYLEYDSLLTLSGLIIMFYTGYIWINKLPANPDGTLIVFFTIGYGIFLYGLFEMKENYAIEYNIKRLKYEIQRWDLIEEIKKRNIPSERIALIGIRKQIGIKPIKTSTNSKKSYQS